MAKQVFEHGHFGVIEKDKDMGRFDDGFAAYCHTRGQTVEHGAFRGADERFRTGGVVVGFKVQGGDEASLNFVANGAFHKHKAFVRRKDTFCHVVAHGLV